MPSRFTFLSLAVITACTAPSPTDPEDDGPGPKGDDPTEGRWWRPAPGTSWQWQLSGTIDPSFDVAMYDVDLEVPTAVHDRLHADGRIVICYFSAGSREAYRSDVGDLPPAAIGRTLDGWPDERWLDVRHPAVRALATHRLDRAVAAGCDGVEPDNVDGYANATGFDLTAADQLAFNRFLAAEAHARGLSVGLKNDLDQVDALVGAFDWALDEQCLEYDECAAETPFIDAGKPVFHVEYAGSPATVCPAARALGFDTLIKDLDLGAPRTACE